MFEKNLGLTELYDIYYPLFTDSQKNIFELYYIEDLSLSEIAENTGITRQGVRESLKHTEELLLDYENKIQLLQKSRLLKERTVRLENILSSLENKESDDFSKSRAEISALCEKISQTFFEQTVTEV